MNKNTLGFLQRLVMAFAPAVKQEFAGTMARETASRNGKLRSAN